MALNKDILGQALYNALSTYNNKNIAMVGDIEAARLAFCTTIADAIITHIISNGELSVPGTGLFAGSIAVTGNSLTGKIK